jgi:hypothetical protein
MITTKIKYTGDLFGAYEEFIKEKSSKARGPILQLLRECTASVVSHRQENTNRLASSWQVQSKGGFNFTCINSVYYAFWFFYGRGQVRPVRARRLHYWINGQEIYSKYSRPTAPQLPRFLNSFESGLGEIINGS